MENKEFEKLSEDKELAATFGNTMLSTVFCRVMIR